MRHSSGDGSSPCQPANAAALIGHRRRGPPARPEPPGAAPESSGAPRDSPSYSCCSVWSGCEVPAFCCQALPQLLRPASPSLWVR